MVELQDSDPFCSGEPVLEVESPVFETSNNSCTNNVEFTPGKNIGAKANVWDKEQTLLLLDLCQQHHDELNNPRYKKTEIFKTISSEIKSQGHEFSADQCANRMKTLIVKYKEVKDHNARTGNHPKEWQYFKLVANYLGERPGITPPAVCSSISKSMALSSTIQEKKCDDQQTPECSSGKQNKKEGRKVRSSPRTDMLHWLNEYKADVERREERRLQLVQEQHADTKGILSEILTLLKKKDPEDI